MSPELVIGTRGSRLAQAQARIAARALGRVAPGLSIRIATLSTAGDRDLTRPAWELESGAFTTDLGRALIAGTIDLAVHSTKDLPLVREPGLVVPAVLRRADPRDAIVSPFGALRDLPAGARVGTSSPSRARQLLALRPDLVPTSVRGPVDHRIGLIGHGYEAMLLAAAGLDRLGHIGPIDRLSPRIVVPAPAQGALALEVREGDDRLRLLLRRLRHRSTWLAVRAERALLRAATIETDVPVGALARREGSRLVLVGLVGREGDLIRGTIRGPAARAVELGRRLAAWLLTEPARLGAAHG